MSKYPEVVSRIIDDYLERLKLQLRPVPDRERDEFLREIESHLYEAYQEAPGDDDVARILAVLRKLGEPAEVVSDRLPVTIVRSGARRKMPLQVVGGILIALFGIPLGFGGAGVLMGVLATLGAVMVAYYAAAGAILLTGGIFMVLGMVRICVPGLWDKLVTLGFISMDGPVAAFLDQLTPAGQAFLMLVAASVFVASGVGMLRLGKNLLRGLQFLVSLTFDRTRRLAQRARQWFVKPDERDVRRPNSAECAVPES